MNSGKNYFWRGLLAGFAAPYASLFGGQPRLPAPTESAVAAAWERTGASLRWAMHQEEMNSGQAAEAQKRGQ